MAYGGAISAQQQIPGLVHEAATYGQSPYAPQASAVPQAPGSPQLPQAAASGAPAAGGQPFSITQPAVPATDGDIVVYGEVEKALTSRKTEDKVNGLIHAAEVAESQLPTDVRTAYNKALYQSTRSGTPPNFTAINKMLTRPNGKTPPPGPFTVWYLDAFLYLMNGAGQRNAAAKAGSGAAAMSGQHESPPAAPVVASTAASQSNQQTQKSS